MSFVINHCCGKPNGECSCGRHQPNRVDNNDKQPAGGSLAQNSAAWGFDASQQRGETRGSVSIQGQSRMVNNDKLPAGGSLADCAAAING